MVHLGASGIFPCTLTLVRNLTREYHTQTPAQMMGRADCEWGFRRAKRPSQCTSDWELGGWVRVCGGMRN